MDFERVEKASAAVVETPENLLRCEVEENVVALGERARQLGAGCRREPGGRGECDVSDGAGDRKSVV